MPVIPGESCVGLFGCWVFNFKGFFLVQYLLDRQTWKHQQNSCLLHFVSTLLKQKSFVYMFCVNKQHCAYTHINNLQIMYFSSWEEQFGKVSSISYLLGSKSKNYTCQVFWILMSDSQILTNTYYGSVSFACSATLQRNLAGSQCLLLRLTTGLQCTWGT